MADSTGGNGNNSSGQTGDPTPGNQGAGGTTRVVPSAASELGTGGTTRVIPAASADVGSAGTTRVKPDVSGDLGAGGTTRVNAANDGAPTVGQYGTVRMGADTGQMGTTRVGATTALRPAPIEYTDRFAVGQSVILNGLPCRIEAELSATSSEAIIYTIDASGETRVLKRYRQGIRMPGEVLGKIKAAPHPNVVQIFDFAQINGEDLELLELLPGGSLDKYIRSNGAIRSLNQLRKLGRAIAQGLHHLHSVAGIIYQDLKPENILLGDGNFNKVVLGDFGISSAFQPGRQEALVKAHGTKEYAAPELSRFGNQTDTLVDVKVDYFAFGITLLECWMGTRPFDGMPDALRLAQIRNKEVVFPADIDKQLGALIKGLLNPLPKERWGRDEILRWLDGKSLQVDYRATRKKYETRWFNDHHSFSDPVELASLLEQNPAKGADYLFFGRIREWLDEAGDMDLSTEIQKIGRQFDTDEAHRRAGVTRAIFSLDPGRPFVTAGGKTCVTAEEFGDALLAERNYYAVALKNPLDRFHLFLQATGEGDSSSTILALYLSSRSPEFAFNKTVYTLQGAGRDRVKLSGKFYFLPDEFNSSTDAQARNTLQADLLSGSSRSLIWLQQLKLIENVEGLADATPVDAMAILRAFPWISYKDCVPDWESRQAAIIADLSAKGRWDLVEVFLAQGLSFNCRDKYGQSPLHKAIVSGYPIAVKYILEHGADIEYQDSHGQTPLFYAVALRKEDCVELLLKAGAAVNHRGQSGETPLALASAYSNFSGTTYPVVPSLVGLLLSNGAQPDTANPDGKLPLHTAIADATTGADAQKLLELFLKHRVSLQKLGEDPVLSAKETVSALVCALENYEYRRKRDPSFLPLIPRMIEAGSSPNELCAGKTPLHLAASWGNETLCKTLLAKGASRLNLADDGRLPATYARAANAGSLEKLLTPGTNLKLRRIGWTFLNLVAKTIAYAWLLLALGIVGETFQEIANKRSSNWYLGYALIQCVLFPGWIVSAGSFKKFASELRAGVTKWRVIVGVLLLIPAALLVVAVAATWGLESVGASLFVDNLVSPGVFSLTDNRSLAHGLLLGAVLGVSAVAMYAVTLVNARAVRLDAIVGQLRGNSGSIAGKFSRGFGSTPTFARIRRKKPVWLFALVVLLGTTQFISFRLRHQQSRAAGHSGAAAEIGNALTGLRHRDTTNAVTTENYEMTANDDTKCVLPAGTRLIYLKEAPKMWKEPRDLVTIPVIRGDCVGKFTSSEQLGLPKAIVDRVGLRVSPRVGTQTSRPQPQVDRVASKAGLNAVKRRDGSVTGLDGDGWPVIEGSSVPLYGIGMIADGQREQFRSWFRVHENYIHCVPKDVGRFQCVTNENLDVAQALLLDGAGTVSAEAPNEYRDAMMQAMREKRGQWSQ